MTKRIFITGYYGFRNTGDEAILTAMVAHLRELRPEVQITATSATPETTAAALGIEAVLWSDVCAMLEAVRRSDLVIIGGGGIFHDYWGFNPNTFFTNDHSGIGFCSAPAAMAVLFEKPVMLYAAGVGPLFSDHARAFTKMACDVAAAITVRDAASRRTLESIGVIPDRVRITADPAFGLAIEETPAAIEGLKGERPRVAVALRQWSVGIDPKVWEQEAAAGLDRFLDQHSGSVLFVPFQQLKSVPEDDALIAQRVQALMKHKGRTAVLASGVSPQQMVKVLGECDLVVGMRLHSMILGMLAKAPLLALSYDSKVDEVMARAGMRTFNLDIRSFDAATLASKMEEALAAKRVAPVEGFADAARQNARIAVEILDREAKPSDLNREVIALLGRGFQAQLRESHHLRLAYQDAFIQHKRILAERDKGIAFLRNDVAARNEIIAERSRAVEFLKNEVARREAELALLRSEIELRDEIMRDRQDSIEFLQKETAARNEGIGLLREEISQREEVIAERQKAIQFLQQQVAARDLAAAAQNQGIAFLRGELAQRETVISELQGAIEFLQQEVAGRDLAAAAENEGIAFLQDEVAQREALISERQGAIEFLQKEVAAQNEGIAFLRGEVAQREAVISERQRAIEFLQQEAAARDVTAAAQLEGIAFLRGEVVQRERVIEERERQLLESGAEIARLRNTVRELEATLPWLRRWLLGRSRREGSRESGV